MNVLEQTFSPDPMCVEELAKKDVELKEAEIAKIGKVEPNDSNETFEDSGFARRLALAEEDDEESEHSKEETVTISVDKFKVMEGKLDEFFFCFQKQTKMSE